MSEDIGDEELIAAAREAQAKAWCPYSGFAVGAALLTDSGEVFAGCNVENASYGLTICAERTAVVRAIAEGVRTFVAIAVVTDAEGPLMPCGACRQFLAEFAPKLRVIAAGRGAERETRTLDALLPGAFLPSSLPR